MGKGVGKGEGGKSESPLPFLTNIKKFTLTPKGIPESPKNAVDFFEMRIIKVRKLEIPTFISKELIDILTEWRKPSLNFLYTLTKLGFSVDSALYSDMSDSRSNTISEINLLLRLCSDRDLKRIKIIVSTFTENDD